jgi:predicted HTH transcriptional regulator
VEKLIAAIDFESAEARSAKKALEIAKAKIAELSADYTAKNKVDNGKKTDATRLAKRLLKEGLSEDTVAELLRKEYGRTRKPAPTGEARKSHKIEAEAQEAVLNFINSKPETTAREIWDQFQTMDKQGISMTVKKLVVEGKIRAEGNTRQRKYYPIQ